ncbi:MAG: vWA domain-containing protein [Actinomycetota bacterium]
MPRRELEKHEQFEDVSPDVGQLDETAFEELLEEDADEALSMLANMTGATDERLRALARRLAARVVLDLSRSGPPRARGVGRLRPRSAAQATGDLDIEASFDAIAVARAGKEPPALDDLVVREWSKPDTALCLVIDASGSMGGERLAIAGLAAAAAAFRAPVDHSVLAFSDKVIAVKSQDVMRDAEAVVDDVFCLRGHGPTDLHHALTQARLQLGRSRAKRRITVLLSDCEATEGEDPVLAARLLDELLVIAPEDAAEDAERLAMAVGAQMATLSGPSDVGSAFGRLLDR